jgi:hypothetical protein
LGCTSDNWVAEEILSFKECGWLATPKLLGRSFNRNSRPVNLS